MNTDSKDLQDPEILSLKLWLFLMHLTITSRAGFPLIDNIFSAID